jgi:hypothetical protein
VILRSRARTSAWSSSWSKARTWAETTGRWPRRIQLAAVERGTEQHGVTFFASAVTPGGPGS